MVIARKPPELKMDVDLRTPVTREQKALIQAAATAEGLGVASWCRQVLLRAAKKSKAAERGGYDPVGANADPSGSL
jgi:uncharacterized protein (DUF1778 family)